MICIDELAVSTARLVLLTLSAAYLVTSSTSSPLPLLAPASPLPRVLPEWLLDRLDVSRTSFGERRTNPPKWVNPCGGVEVDADTSPASDARIAAFAVLDVQLALFHVQHFKDRFVSFFLK